MTSKPYEYIEEELEKAISSLECPGYTHAPHTADIIVVAKGKTLEEAFEYAAAGVYEIITDTEKVEPRVRKKIIDDGIDLNQLLYKWIEDLLFYTDSENIVFSKFNVEKIYSVEENSEKLYKLEAEAWGDYMDPEKHPPKTIVKAMTYALMEIVEEDNCWRVQFVVDI